MKIRLDGVGKSFGSRPALREVDAELGAGVVALLGRNGAGKSTLLSILAGLAAESQGQVMLDGAELRRDRRALRAGTTLLAQDLRLDPRASARDMVGYLLDLRARPDTLADAMFTAFGLDDVRDRRLGALSGGTRQRVGLAYAFAADTPALLLDEPTQGLDPWERLRFTEQLAAVAADKLVVYSTHVVSDVEAIAERVLVLDEGRVVHDGSPRSLIGRTPPVWETEADHDTVLALRAHVLVTAVKRLDEQTFRMRWVGDRRLADATGVSPTLTDAYIALTGAAR